MSPIDLILEDLKKGALESAKEAGAKFVKEARKDGLEFVEKSAPKIGRYLDLLLRKEITEEDFKCLMIGLKDLTQMNALHAAQLAAIEIDKTKDALLQTVTSIALGAARRLV